MRCELCTRKLGRNEISHGIRYGTADEATNLFIPAKDSAWTVICGSCGEKIYRLIYSSLGRTSNNPTIYRAFMQTK